MNVFAHVSPCDVGFEHGDSVASLLLPRASVTSACAASSSAFAITGSTRCASLYVKPPPCRESGGKFALGAMDVPSSAWTEASYSALVMRRMLGGSSTAPPGMLTHAPLMHMPLQARLQPPQW